MHAPQIILIVWLILNAIAGLCVDGKKRDGTYNGWCIVCLNGLEFALLLWGGFFHHAA